MNIIRYPKREDWASITERPQLDTSTLNATVSNILGDIKANGDEAVRKYEEMQSCCQRERDRGSLEQRSYRITTVHRACPCQHKLFPRGTAFQRREGRNCSRSDLLAEERTYREGWTLYSRRDGTAVLYSPHACHPSQDCWL